MSEEAERTQPAAASGLLARYRAKQEAAPDPEAKPAWAGLGGPPERKPAETLNLPTDDGQQGGAAPVDPPAAQPAPAPATAPSAEYPAPTVARRPAGTKRVSFDLAEDLFARARVTFRKTRDLEDVDTWAGFIARALERETIRLEQEYNGGARFEGTDRPLPRGLPAK